MKKKKKYTDFSDKKRRDYKQPERKEPPAKAVFEEMRLNKYIAHSGVCSRRQAVEYVKDGLVKVNGEVVKEPWYLVKKNDKVSYKNASIRLEERKVYILLNKPKDIITTVKDDRGRKTVLDLIGSRVKERIFPVGRLDRATTGLLLLTNDGDLAKRLSHPSHKVKKFYQVLLNKPLSKEHLRQIQAGLELEDGKVVVDDINYVRDKGKDEIGIEIHIGKNRIIRRIFEHFGYAIKRLDRVYYAGLTKKDLPRGRYRFLTEREVVMLRHFV